MSIDYSPCVNVFIKCLFVGGKRTVCNEKRKFRYLPNSNKELF